MQQVRLLIPQNQVIAVLMIASIMNLVCILSEHAHF